MAAQFYNAVDALNYLRNKSVDLVFLDIDMPEISGIDLLKSLSNAPKTILTTAHSQYVLESYDYGIIDYLLKPISLTRFIKATERFLSLYQRDEPFEPQEITVNSDGRNMLIKTDHIDYIQSYGKYVKIFTTQKVHLVSATTQEILTGLSPRRFIRIHKSYIVNIDKVKVYTENEVTINSEKLPLGITFKREFLERIEKKK